MIVRLATLDDVTLIHILAHQIWPVSYRNILSQQQIDFMLQEIYSLDSLKVQFETSTFLIVEEHFKAIGFASYSVSHKSLAVFKIHKLYILPAHQGKGVGKLLCDTIKEQVVKEGGQHVELNVNRNNPAVAFYLKYGFSIFSEVDIPYHQFILNDFILRLPL